MSSGAFRALAGVIWVGGIAGMIVSSINGNNNGWVATFGLATAAASVVLLAVSAATNRDRIDVFEEADAERLEAQISDVVSQGADEESVRALVRDAMRFGRRR